ncbi:MAG: hypothetical protein WAV89_11490 [Ignavibacteriaceae bacterium]
MEEFQRQIGNGYIIEKINLTSVDLSKVAKFKKHIDTDLNLGYKIIIVDLNNCFSLDPAFVGVLVVTLKQLIRLGGSVKIVKQGMFSNSHPNFTETMQIFELYESIENAIESVQDSLKHIHDDQTSG